jgi:alkylation response protein AidB-like acyl-CoA dehydrogenase
MRFRPEEEQLEFARAVRELLAGSDTPGVARSWATGDFAAGRKLWTRLIELGLAEFAEEPVGLVLAVEELGRAAVAGPCVEALAVLPALRPSGEAALATLAFPPHVPFALDADAADAVYVVDEGRLWTGRIGARVESVDRTRRLAEVEPDADLGSVETDRGFELGVLATAAQLSGLGAALLERSSAYAKQRQQFGRVIGSFQAVKHQLADVAVALELARPLLFGAALSLAPRDVSAARIACGDAAYAAARTALQVHGAIGYTAEYDLALWLTKVRALLSAWGTARVHRDRVLAAIR